MPSATVTLSTTTLARPCAAGDNSIQVASTSGLTAGVRLYLDRELASVVSISTSSDNIGTWINVRRGVDNTEARGHAAGITITIGRADQFYQLDPQGQPPAVVLVSPHINTANGVYWFVMGDDVPDGNSNRWWQAQTTTYGIGANGVRTVTQFPPESTAP